MTVNLIRGSLCKCDLNAKYNDAGNCGECILEERTRSSFKEIVEVVQICLKCLPYSRLPELVFNLDDFCRALAC